MVHSLHTITSIPRWPAAEADPRPPHPDYVGPHALACAALLGSRVTACATISGDGPYATMGTGGGRDTEQLLKNYGTAAPVEMEAAVAQSKKFVANLTESYVQMAKPDRRAMALSDIQEATRAGFEGVASDALLESRVWPFSLRSIHCKVLIHHGEDDADVPIRAARYMAAMLPNCTATYVAGETHSMIRRRFGSVLEELVAASKTADGDVHPKM